MDKIIFTDRDYLEEILSSLGIHKSPEEFCISLAEKLNDAKDNYELVLDDLLAPYANEPNVNIYNTYAEFHNAESIYPIEKFDEICATFVPLKLVEMCNKGNFIYNASNYFTFDNGAIININESNLIDNKEFSQWYIRQQFDDVYTDPDFYEDIINGIQQIKQNIL